MNEQFNILIKKGALQKFQDSALKSQPICLIRPTEEDAQNSSNNEQPEATIENIMIFSNNSAQKLYLMVR